MSFMDILSRIEVLFPKVPVHTQEEEKDRERDLVSRYAQGNIFLRLGKYVTKSDADKRRADIVSHKF